eukprot:TRINITY_DN19630_c0_g1_i3.p1 TRINITY_DN19630_c0_g1~~TRINITY_DN19630_c0_g1_i3.p1  ORF type:complete len:320 (+),score=47.28 TRINITY_DN19630_c0_g1_i3:89-1048(+)
MACKVTGPSFAVYKQNVSIQFQNFKALWNARNSEPKGLTSDNFAIAYAKFHVTLGGTTEEQPGYVSLHLWLHEADRMPVEISLFSVAWNGRTNKHGSPHYFLPDYAISDFTFPPSTNIFQGEGLGWNEWKKVEDLLAHAEQNGDAVSSNVVKMPDVSEKVLDSLEDCLHECGLPQHLAEDWHGLLDLLVVAKKYEIQNLVDACTFFLSCALTGENVSELLLKADKYRLTKLLRAAMYFAVGSDMAHSAVLASDEFEAFPSELLRLFVAYQKVRKTGDGNLSAPPPFFQWGNVPEEFGAGTDWKSLDKCRSCVFLERSRK